jgi:membrane-bound serine protease (ClpP class)
MLTLGVVLLAVGVVFFIVEAHLPTAGVVGALGVVALIGGACVLAASAGAAASLVVASALVVGVVGASFLGLFATKARVAAGRKVRRGGGAGLIGRVGTVQDPPDPVGQVLVEGAVWKARLSLIDLSDDGSAGLQRGDAVVIEGVKGLTLSVRRAEQWEID